MKYFLDTEFIEGKQTYGRSWFNFFIKNKPTIDLISIGIVAEDGREYYAISKDFNLEEAWNRYDLIKDGFRDAGMTPNYRKVYWIRENVLRPIWDEWVQEKDIWDDWSFTYKNFKKHLKKYGKSNKQIAKEVRNFVMSEKIMGGGQIILGDFYPNDEVNPQFYAYYADYDWVAFCWLFGNMIDLPKEFPMYCNDLKQEMDRIGYNKKLTTETLDSWIEQVKKRIDYPKQTNEHNALADAKWNKKLYEFLNSL